MSWEDSDALVSRSNRSLDAFNWKEAEAICDEIIKRIKTDSELFPESSAKRLLTNLRRKRRFELVTRVAEALLQSGLTTPLLRRQYAQALIDLGSLAAAEALLRFSLLQGDMNVIELNETHGLLGRVYKQLYINNSKSPGSRLNLERAIKEYFEIYNLDRKNNLWHGINVVACVLRAQRDDQPVGEWPDPLALAHNILETLEEQEKDYELPVWDLATRMEAYVAIGAYRNATTTALKYISSEGADAFELKSTLRQLTEVWQLNEQDPPGKQLLPILRAAHLSKVPTTEGDLRAVIAEGVAAFEAVNDLAGADTAPLLKWYKTALERCRAIARIETVSGKSLGIGWLVNSSDFFPNMTGVLLLTNEHVISNNSAHSQGVRPEAAQANFQFQGKICRLKKIIWSSPAQKLDASFVSLKETPDAAPLRLAPDSTFEPSTRLCIISQESGNESTKVVVQDTFLLAQNESVFHYRTPEEGICSGTPVFESEDWRVVALHHASNAVMPRIDGREGAYEASEGISIAAIRRAVQAAKFEVFGSAKGMGFRGIEKAGETSKASFRITLEGDAVATTAVKYGTNVDLVFEYVPPAGFETTYDVERTQKLQVPLGIMVVPLGFKFRLPEEKGYRHVRFYQSGANEKVRFELRASSHAVDTTSIADQPSPETGFHIIFDLRGAVLRQLFVPAQLVRDLSEASEEIQAPERYTFDLADLKQFDDDTVQAQQRVAVALQQVLS